jgi:hypothetical protein
MPYSRQSSKASDTTVSLDTDPGDLFARLDHAVRKLLERGVLDAPHVRFDGTPHITSETLERIEADLLPVRVWRGGTR